MEPIQSLLPTRLSPADIPDLTAFLEGADLTLSGLDSPGIRLWILRDRDGVVRGSTGYEICSTGEHALVRSVAVDTQWRQRGLGLSVGQFALDRATEEGAERAWLFSRRSGAFWQRLGFAPADRTALAQVLADSHQVRMFIASGQLDREVAWSRPLFQRAARTTTPVCSLAME